jgi:hypothetical protein
LNRLLGSPEPDSGCCVFHAKAREARRQNRALAVHALSSVTHYVRDYLRLFTIIYDQKENNSKFGYYYYILKYVEKDLMNKNGIILIDDIGSNIIGGKGKYSIPFLLENGYEIVMHEYQVLMKKIS